MFFDRTPPQEKKFSPYFTTDEFSNLKTRRLSEYFPNENIDVDSPSTLNNIADHLSFDDQTLSRFRHDFDRLVGHRKNFQGLSKATSFKKWWEENQGQYLTRPVVENFKKADLTLGAFLDDLHFHFIAGQVKQKSSSPVVRFISRLTRARIFIALGFSIAVILHRVLIFGWSLLILGPGVQMINSYTQPVITPMAQTAAQKGSKDLATFAAAIQSWMTNRGALREVNRDLHATTEKLQRMSFKTMSPDQIKTKWAEFEKTYFTIFQRYNQALPSHLRDGRSFFRDWMVLTPIGLATNVAAFDTQYWTHKRELEALNTKAQRRSLTQSEKKLLDLHTSQMDAAESRISGTLAAWKLYEFMFPEFSHEAARLKGSADLKIAYNVLADAMHFEIYIQQFSERVTQILKQMDADFLMQDAILRVSQGQSLPVTEWKN